MAACLIRIMPYVIADSRIISAEMVRTAAIMMKSVMATLSPGERVAETRVGGVTNPVSLVVEPAELCASRE